MLVEFICNSIVSLGCTKSAGALDRVVLVSRKSYMCW